MTGGGNRGTTARTSTAPSGDGGAAAQGSQAPAGQAAPAADSGDSGDPSSTTTYNGIQDRDVAVNAGESITARGVTITSAQLTAGDATLGPTACTSVTVQNSSGKEIDFNLLEFKLLSPSGAIVNVGFAGSTNILQSGTLIDGGSTSGDAEQIEVALDTLPDAYRQIIFAVAIYKGHERKQSFAGVRRAHIRAVDGKGQEICRYNIGSDPANHACAMTFASVVRGAGGWNFNAIGEFHDTDRFIDLLKRYLPY